MRDYKIIVALADLHIGRKSVSPESMKMQLKKNLLSILKQMPYIDGIFICGDLMHRVVSLDSDYSNLMFWLIDKLYKIARDKGSTFIFIKGTQAHDSFTYLNVKHYINNDDGVDFRIYETVEEITLWDDYKVLVLPDVRVKQYDEIDKHLKDKKYDFILGHGTIDQMKFTTQESEIEPTKAYIYKLDKLMDASRSFVLFGHIHNFMNYSDRFYYIGPFTVLERGGNSSGFVVAGIYDKDRTKYVVEHVNNPDSAEYFDIVVTEEIFNTFPVSSIIEAIDDIRDHAKENDLITLRIIREDDIAMNDKVMILESRYRTDPRFSIVKKIVSKKEQERIKESEERRKKYAYVMDQSIELPTIFYTYYMSDVKPTIADQSSKAANLTEDDFWEALDMKRDAQSLTGKEE